MKKEFGFRKNIKDSWSLYKKNFWGLLVVNLIFTGLVYVINPESQSNVSQANFLSNFSPLTSIISLLVFSFVSCFIIKYSLDILSDEKVKIFTREIKNLIPKFKTYLNILFTTIIYSIMITVGLVLLILPGLYIMGRLFFSFYLIVDKKMNSFEAIKNSWQMTKGFGWRVLGNILKAILLSVLPMFLSAIITSVIVLIFPKLNIIWGVILTFFIFILGYVTSSLLTAPVGMIFLTKLYREFTGEEEKEELAEEITEKSFVDQLTS
jgi:hypothetical protein